MSSSLFVIHVSQTCCCVSYGKPFVFQTSTTLRWENFAFRGSAVNIKNTNFFFSKNSHIDMLIQTLSGRLPPRPHFAGAPHLLSSHSRRSCLSPSGGLELELLFLFSPPMAGGLTSPPIRRSSPRWSLESDNVDQIDTTRRLRQMWIEAAFVGPPLRTGRGGRRRAATAQVDNDDERRLVNT